MDIYDWANRGPLELMVVHAAVQWFALFRCVCSDRVATESDRKIDLSQRVSQHVLRVVGLASV